MKIFEIRLKRPYLRVSSKNHQLSFGGSQMLFESQIGRGFGAKYKKEAGCGVVAFADVLWYLGLCKEHWRTKHVFTEDEYRRYFNETIRSLWGLMPKLGLSIVQPTAHLNRIALMEGRRIRATWGLSIKNFFPRMREMLEQDIPVLMCIPTVYLPKSSKGPHGLWLYQRKSEKEFTKRTMVKSHYVVATGMISIDGEVWIEISSWGQKYYFNQKEYEYLLRNIPAGNVLGNLLYIRVK